MSVPSSGEFVKGDAYRPELTDQIMQATRHAVMGDAKKFVKSVAKKLKLDASKLKVVHAEETRGDNFELIEVKLI